MKNFDVWTFFADDGASPPYPWRRRGVQCFEGARFADSTRRVDLLGRTLKVRNDADPVASVRGYLEDAATTSAWWLAKAAVVVLEPEARRGEVIWLHATGAG